MEADTISVRPRYTTTHASGFEADIDVNDTDVGASQLIVDGKIGLKNDSLISHFAEKSIIFEDGSELPADVAIFATGYGDAKKLVSELAGQEVTSKYGQVWGFNKEGEVNGAWRWTDVPGLYHMLGAYNKCAVSEMNPRLKMASLFFCR